MDYVFTAAHMLLLNTQDADILNDVLLPRFRNPNHAKDILLIAKRLHNKNHLLRILQVANFAFSCILDGFKVRV